MKSSGKATLAAVLVAVAVTSASGAFARDGKGARAFENFDANADGVVTEAEFTEMQNEMFALVDADGSGGISKDEMITHVEARIAESGRTPPAGMLEERVDKRFSKMDSNGDGVLQQGEHQGTSFARIDANGDGQLTQDEFASMKQKRQG